MSKRTKRNFGFGRQMAYATRQVLTNYYGTGRYSTRRSHAERLRPFVAFLLSMGVRDFRDIGTKHVAAYVEHVAELCTSGRLSASTATNRISSVNVLLAALPAKSDLVLAATGLLPPRQSVRTHEPLGISPPTVCSAVSALLGAGEVRLSIVVALARFCGARFREASLMNLRDARRSVKRIKKIVVIAGSKGGRAQHIPRIIDADPMLVSVLFHDDVVALGDHVIPVDWDYARWYRYAHRVWRKWAPKLGLSTRIHDLRAAFACAKYESLTGLPAPCVGHLVLQENGERQAFSVSDEKARRVIAELLGHDRISITDSYLGCE